MGAMIVGSGISADKSIKSSTALASDAAKKALAQANVRGDEVDMVINVGIYRDNNMVEPAMAAMIQKQIGIGLDYLQFEPRKGAFSFDLMNGGIGALNALYTANSMLQADIVKYILIVASDIHPSGNSDDFPFAPVGSALLLKKGTDPARGLQQFEFHSKEHAHAGRSGMVKTRQMGTTGRSRIDIVEAPDYEEAITAFACESAKGFAGKNGLSGASVHLIPSQISAQFVETLTKELGVSADKTTQLHKEYGDTHSSTFGMGFHQLHKQGKAKAGEKILMAGASSGLATGCVLYVC